MPPDVVEDFFELCTRIGGRMPRAMYVQAPPSLLYSLVACAAQCALVQQREAFTTVCHFLTAVLSEGSDGSLARLRRRTATEGASAVRSLLQQQPDVALSLLQSAAFAIAVHHQPHRLAPLVDWLLLLGCCLPDDFAALLQRSFAPYTQPPPSSSGPPLLTEPLVRDLVQALEDAVRVLSQHAAPFAVKSAVRAINDRVERFADMARRRMRRAQSP